ncbi:hypothetical protein K3495_g7096 [Podosphaera aphanis]|nr:hypothetical protein K3495_g7096 [Podosphaera aphanis]
MTSREDRIQQRLRGAQRRQVRDVDFGLVFPAAFGQQSLESNQPEINSVPSSLSLVAAESIPTNLTSDAALKNSAEASTKILLTPKERTSRKSISSLKSDNAPKNSTFGSSGNVSTPNANTSRKRRKLENSQITSTLSQNSRSSRRESILRLSTPNGNDVAYAGDVSNIVNQKTNLIDESHEVETELPKPSSSGRTLAKSRVVEEVTESPPNAPGSGQRVRSDRSFMISSRTSNLLRDSSEQPEISTPQSPIKNGQKLQTRLESPDLSQNLSVEFFRTPGDKYELDRLCPRQDNGENYLPEVHTPHTSTPLRESYEQETAEAIDDEQMVVSLNENRGKQNQGIRGESPDLGTPIVYNSKNKSRKTSLKLHNTLSQVEAQAKTQVQNKNQNRKKKISKSQRSLRDKPRSGSPIPIKVHRLTNPKTYDDEFADLQIMNMEMSHIRRNDVNVMDVLSQICHEVIESEMDTLQEKFERCKNSIQRREYRTKRHILELFDNNLQTRLLEYSLNLDNVHSLERRLRDEQKRKIHLRSEVLRVRNEREKVALQMDEIRIQHERVRNVGIAQDNLNDALHHVDLAVDTGREKFPNASNDLKDFIGTQLLVKKIAQDVSSKSATGGLLNQVKEFNGFLERASVALENQLRLQRC